MRMWLVIYCPCCPCPVLYCNAFRFFLLFSFLGIRTINNFPTSKQLIARLEHTELTCCNLTKCSPFLVGSNVHVPSWNSAMFHSKFMLHRPGLLNWINIFIMYIYSDISDSVEHKSTTVPYMVPRGRNCSFKILLNIQFFESPNFWKMIFFI